MAKSMTGYGRAQQTVGSFDIAVEIKAVNHRYADFNLRMPRSCGFLEEELRRFLKERINRGKVDVSVSLSKQNDDTVSVKLNAELAGGYVEAMRELSRLFGLRDDISVSTVARFHDVFETARAEEDEEALRRLVFGCAEEALTGFMEMRRREGETLCADMLMRCGLIGGGLSRVEELAPQTVREHREKIEQRIRELLQDAPPDENRLLTETAIFADKLSVTEEIIRLKSHLAEFARILGGDGAVGRKLDFLLQEMNREINTIGSKSTSLEIARLVVDMKAELEKIREQLQNVE